MGMSRVTGSSSSISATLQPSRPGIITSRRMTSGCLARARSSPLGTVTGLAHRHPLGLQVHAAEQPDRRLVVDDEHAGHERRLATGWAASARLAPGERQLEREARPLGLLGVHPDPPAHGGDEAANEEEARARCPARPRPLRPRKNFDEDPLLVGRRCRCPRRTTVISAASDRPCAATVIVLRPRANKLTALSRRLVEHLQQFLPIGPDGEPRARSWTTNRWPASCSRSRPPRPPPGRPLRRRSRSSVSPSVPASRRATLSRSSTIRIRRSDSDGDVAEEGLALGLGEVDVPAQERLGEAVDRGERRAKLVRDRGDEVGLHLLDHPLARDVAEGEDPPGDRAGRVEHHRLAEREPALRCRPLDGRRGARARRSAPSAASSRWRTSGTRRPSASDAGTPVICSAIDVPEDDPVLAVDGDDAVGDVGEDRAAPLLLLGDALVELGVRDRGRGGRRARADERLHLVVAPAPAGRWQYTASTPYRPPPWRDQRDGHAGGRSPLQQRSPRASRACSARVLDRERRPRLRDGAGDCRRGARAACRPSRSVPGPAAARTTSSSPLEEPDHGGVGVEQARRLARDLLEHDRRVEARGEERADLSPGAARTCGRGALPRTARCARAHRVRRRSGAR